MLFLHCPICFCELHIQKWHHSCCRTVNNSCMLCLAALEEARDITTHLKPLRRLLDDMEQFDFSELDKILPAIIHTVGLIWANSKYYCSPPRIIVLLQELCNMLIEMVSKMGRNWFMKHKNRLGLHSLPFSPLAL